MSQQQPLLDAKAITKRFSGITALDGVNLEVAEHEIVGLIGPNGAGKTTFFNCLLGMLRPDDGEVLFAGQDITKLPVYKRSRLGFGRTFQRIELFSGLTVREHLLIAERVRRGDGRLWKDFLNLSGTRPEEAAAADSTLELLELSDVAEAPVESLSLGRGRLVELGRALMTEPKLLLLDEPSSGLDQVETRALTEVLRVVNRERGTAILLVEHDVEMVQSIAQRLYVLDFGVLIASGATDDVLADKAVRAAYIGDSAVSS
jgi:branched-chain amino acid transport system ATP-binding protein